MYIYVNIWLICRKVGSDISDMFSRRIVSDISGMLEFSPKNCLRVVFGIRLADAILNNKLYEKCGISRFLRLQWKKGEDGQVIYEDL